LNKDQSDVTRASAHLLDRIEISDLIQRERLARDNGFWEEMASCETPCTLRSFFKIDDVDVSYEGFVRLLWRAKFLEGKWLIAGLRAIYVRDMLYPCTPNLAPSLDTKRLAEFRSPYRYLAYNFFLLGMTIKNDLPGVDIPETVALLRANEKKWLAQR
jgi:hypothetical protein